MAFFRSFLITVSRGGAGEEAVELYRIAPSESRVEDLIVLNMVNLVEVEGILYKMLERDPN